MVKFLKKLCLFMLLPLSLFSGEFTASVDRNQLNVGENLTLNLTLKGASTKSTPPLESLKDTFSIHSQRQQHNTTVVNGHASASTTWKYILIPQKEGVLTIPQIDLETSEGILSTTPITLQVNKKAASNNAVETPEVNLKTTISNAKPYKNEPILYMIRLSSRMHLTDIKIEDFTIPHTIVEPNNDPKIEQKVIDGVAVTVVDFEYLIIPLKSDSLIIPRISIQGAVLAPKKNRHGSFADDDFGPFAMFGGLNRWQPFALTTEETPLEIQPSVADVTPWLPAHSLKIEEIWNQNQLLQVGEPFTRELKIIAEGVKSSQLPDLNNSQSHENHLKVYQDKSELVDEKKNALPISYRHERFTYIPQQSGTLILPELSVTWWDTTKKEKVITKVPSRTLQIAPASNHVQNEISPPTIEGAASVPQEITPQHDPLLYGLIIGLILILVIAIFVIIALQRKLTRFAPQERRVEKKAKQPQLPVPSKQEEDKQKKLPDLNPT